MAKRKKVKLELIDPERHQEPYELLQRVRESWHPDTLAASVGLAWMIDQKCDPDGRLTLGRCCKATDLQRELADYDFIVLLNQEVWGDVRFGEDKKLALLDHEMMHASRSIDGEGCQRRDTKNRLIWRIRKHDIEEFTSVVRRHGIYKSDLQAFAEALKTQQATPLFAAEHAEATIQ